MNKAKIFTGPELSGKTRIARDIASKFKNPHFICARGGRNQKMAKYFEKIDAEIAREMPENCDLLIIDDLYLGSVDWILHFISKDYLELNHIGRASVKIKRPDLIFILEGVVPADFFLTSRRMRIQHYDLARTPYDKLFGELHETAVFQPIGSVKKNFLQKPYDELTESEIIKSIDFLRARLRISNVKESNLERDLEHLRAENKELKSIIEWVSEAYGNKVNTDYASLSLVEFLRIFNEESGLNLDLTEKVPATAN
tara:strand:- start:3000 stop:3767 length:768 start_codon:yes stop_codon:yes gene_type:complete